MKFGFTGKKIRGKTFRGFTLSGRKHHPFVPEIRIAGDTCAGLVREKNEDSFAFHTGPHGARSVFAAVADGIGSLGNGDLASRMVLQQMIVAWRKFALGTHSSELCRDFLQRRIEDANTLIRRDAEQRSFRQYMGCTIASMILSGNFAITAHAGDSRIYRLRGGVLERLTRDHTVVEKLIASGKITREQAPFHPMAHMISRAVGIQENMQVDVQMFDFQIGDRYLLCSDGLYLHLSDPEIGALLDEALSPSKAIQLMMGKTIQRGAEDNVTILTVFA